MGMGQKLSKETLAAIAIALLSLVLSAFTSYNNNDKIISNRVTAIEVQQKNDADAIKRIEAKTNEVNSKMDQLLMFFGATTPPRKGR